MAKTPKKIEPEKVLPKRIPEVEPEPVKVIERPFHSPKVSFTPVNE